MKLARRQLLKLATALPLSLSGYKGVAANNTETDSVISFLEVKDEVAAPVLKQGDHVLLDTGVNFFKEEGVYLYPTWGRPRAYLVKEGPKGVLCFYNPGQKNVLWTMESRIEEELFAGRAIGVLAADSTEQINRLVTEYSLLNVPELPVVGTGSV